MRATSLLPRSGAVNSSNWSTADFGLPRAHILSSSSTVSWIRGITTPTCFSWQVYFIWFVFLVGGGSPLVGHLTRENDLPSCFGAVSMQSTAFPVCVCFPWLVDVWFECSENCFDLRGGWTAKYWLKTWVGDGQQATLQGGLSLISGLDTRTRVESKYLRNRLSNQRSKGNWSEHHDQDIHVRVWFSYWSKVTKCRSTY